MVTLGYLAQQLGGEVLGDSNVVISSIATLSTATSGQISFLANSKYTSQLADCKASAVIIAKASAQSCNTNALVVDDPYATYAKVAQLLDTTPKSASDVAASAVIADDVSLGNNVAIGANAVIESGAVIGDNVQIGAGCFIGKNTRLGDNTKLWANVSIYHEVEVGSDCLFHSGVVVGSDGFGFAKEKGKWLKIPQLGRVIVGNKVELGANTTVDRGALGDTIIENGVIIDNQCQIAHNDIIGENTAIAGCTVVAGSTKIGKNCTIGGAVAINGHMSVADNSYITGFSMVTKEITEAGVYSSGMPATTNKEWRKNTARLRQIDAMYKRLAKLEKEMASISEAQD